MSYRHLVNGLIIASVRVPQDSYQREQTRTQGDRDMKRLVTIAALAFAVGLPTAALAETSKADCKAWFDKMDTNKTGYLDGKEADPFLAAMEKAGRTPVRPTPMPTERSVKRSS